ncbi:hypothetical protein CIHG_06667 [Coccidioides immitis H538.4]|nr:hypothetical protein CIRG_01559 [Coccidioides immitis RMSCC 2394]KMU77315.1 hypothetical protein CISG_06356 [Coccidioides immitis RMSCC 3703]KMU88864.1 hypothetical protein CIHG_06667 [Coccidioides immitis H538.4]
MTRGADWMDRIAENRDTKTSALGEQVPIASIAKRRSRKREGSGEQDDHQMPVILEIQGAYSFGEEIYRVGSHDIRWGWQETHIHKSTRSVLLDTKWGIICVGRTE